MAIFNLLKHLMVRNCAVICVVVLPWWCVWWWCCWWFLQWRCGSLAATLQEDQNPRDSETQTLRFEWKSVLSSELIVQNFWSYVVGNHCSHPWNFICESLPHHWDLLTEQNIWKWVYQSKPNPPIRTSVSSWRAASKAQQVKDKTECWAVTHSVAMIQLNLWLVGWYQWQNGWWSVKIIKNSTFRSLHLWKFYWELKKTQCPLSLCWPVPYVTNKFHSSPSRSFCIALSQQTGKQRYGINTFKYEYCLKQWKM